MCKSTAKRFYKKQKRKKDIKTMMGNNEIITLARQLGEALKSCEEYKAFCETRDAMQPKRRLKRTA